MNVAPTIEETQAFRGSEKNGDDAEEEVVEAEDDDDNLGDDDGVAEAVRRFVFREDFD